MWTITVWHGERVSFVRFGETVAAVVRHYDGGATRYTPRFDAIWSLSETGTAGRRLHLARVNR